MTRTTRFRALRATIAALTAAGLALVAATPAIADTPVVLGNFSAPDYTFIISQEDTNPHWFEVDVTNVSAAPITFGLGGALSELGVMEYLWTQELDPSSGSDQFSETILPGESYHDQIPNWPGVEYGFFADINTTPELIGSWTVDGPFFPVEWSDAGDEVAAFQFGYPVALVPSTARAGEQLSISADIGTLGVAAADVRIAPVAELFIQFNGEWDWDADAATPLGSIPVTNGVASGSLSLPTDLATGEYGLLIGDAANDWWIAGPGITFDTLANTQTYTGALVIEAGPPRGATPAGTDVSVMPVDNNGNQPVSFVFDSVGTPGTTTVTTSTTGPTPAGFELQGVYYELSTDAGFSGDVTVCITYDAQGATTPLSLFHFEAGIWVDITDLGISTPGHTCGVTDSFSPFALGVPLPTTYPFGGFYAPVSNTKVNTEFAGTIVPFRFSLGGDQGKQVITSVVSGVSACTVGAAPTSPTTATTPLGIKLQYDRASDTYWWFWQTKANWSGTCRTFVMTLDDGTTHAATFKFQKLTIAALLRAILRVV